MRVGFIGLGDQGGRMALQIARSPFPLTVWARRPAVLEPFAELGSSIASSPAQLGQMAELVGICVVDDAGVEEVVLGRDGVLSGMSEGGIIAVHSTIHPDLCVEIERRARQRGVAVLDAPVSGGGAAAAARTLLVMVGGDAEVVERARPVFETFGDPVRHLGPIGSGQRAKLINNALMAAHLGLANDALVLGSQLGLDRAALGEVLQKGSGRSFGLSALAGAGSMAGLAANVEPLLSKDVRILGDIVDPSPLDPGSLQAVAARALHSMRQA